MKMFLLNSSDENYKVRNVKLDKVKFVLDFHKNEIVFLKNF